MICSWDTIGHWKESVRNEKGSNENSPNQSKKPRIEHAYTRNFTIPSINISKIMIEIRQRLLVNSAAEYCQLCTKKGNAKINSRVLEL